MQCYRRYLIVVLLTMLAATGLVAGVNYRIGTIGWANPRIAEAAVQWQMATHGIVDIASAQEANFKILSLENRLADVDTVILGSSTAQSLRSAFLTPLKAYNFAMPANRTGSVVAQAEYLVATAPNVKWLIVSLDWVLGYVYQRQPPPAVASVMVLHRIPVVDQLQDTLTLPRVLHVATLASEWMRASSPASAAVHALDSAIGESYNCNGDVPGKDFAADDPVRCSGIRWDGSLTFHEFLPLSEQSYRVTLKMRVERDAEYVQAISAGQGKPNAAYLARLAKVSDTLRARGGGMIALLPPLLPGLEQELLNSRLTGRYAQQTKRDIETWAAQAKVILIDAGPSEKFGCKYSEFFDGHHNFGQCYERIFSDAGRIWRQGGTLSPSQHAATGEGSAYDPARAANSSPTRVGTVRPDTKKLPLTGINLISGSWLIAVASAARRFSGHERGTVGSCASANERATGGRCLAGDRMSEQPGSTILRSDSQQPMRP
jgi:hypothetical protein